MSDENVERVRRIADYFNERGELGPMELFDPLVTFTTRGDVGGPQTYSGHRGMHEALANFRQVWAEMEWHLVDFVERGDVVVADFRFKIRSQGGVELETEEAWVYRFIRGKIARIEQYGTRVKALEAAGLRE